MGPQRLVEHEALPSARMNSTALYVSAAGRRDRTFRRSNRPVRGAGSGQQRSPPAGGCWHHEVRWPGCAIRGAARAVPLRPCLALKVHDVEPIGDEVAGVEDGGRSSVALAQHALLVARPFHVLRRHGRAGSLTAWHTLQDL